MISVVPVKVRLGSRLYTYGVAVDPGEIGPGDIVSVPAPPWATYTADQLAPVEEVGSDYVGRLTLARLVRRVVHDDH